MTAGRPEFAQRLPKDLEGRCALASDIARKAPNGAPFLVGGIGSVGSAKRRTRASEATDLRTERLDDHLVRAEEQEVRLEAGIPQREVKCGRRIWQVQRCHHRREEPEALQDGRVG